MGAWGLGIYDNNDALSEVDDIEAFLIKKIKKLINKNNRKLCEHEATCANIDLYISLVKLTDCYYIAPETVALMNAYLNDLITDPTYFEYWDDPKAKLKVIKTLRKKLQSLDT